MDSENQKGQSRRNFIKSMAVGTSAFSIVPRHVLGGPGYQAPSDTVNIAGIGVGGKGEQDIRGVSHENIVALCDVDEERASDSFQRFPDVPKYKDFRVMFDEMGDQIDAVTVSTPDHTHAVAAIEAMERGKHCFCQKPLARTIGEVRAMMDAARRNDVVTQMGNQGHAGEGTRRIREWVEAGVIGTVTHVDWWTNRPIWPQAMERPLEAYNIPPTLDWDLWLGPAEHRPFHPTYAPFKWRGWWAFGTGALGDIACHSMDAAYWTLGLEAPSNIQAEVTELYKETAPAVSRITYEFPARGNRPPVTAVWRDGELFPPRPKKLDDTKSWPRGTSGQRIVGEKGSITAGIYGNGPEIIPESLHKEVQANPPEEKYDRVPGVYKEWTQAIKNGEKAGSDFVEHAGPLTEVALLGNLAVRTRKQIQWDAENMEVSNTSVPEHYIRPEYRDGWQLAMG